MISNLFGDKQKLWVVSPDQDDIYYIIEVHSSTGFLPFVIVYKTLPNEVVDLIYLPGKKNV